MTFLHYLPDFSSRAAYCGAALEDGMQVTPLIRDADCPDCLKPKNEIDYWIGHRAAKDQLRQLLAKVDENMKLGVVRAWLLEEVDDEMPGLRHALPASD